MDYTEYDGATYASPPLYVYDENWKRIVLLSDAAFAEIAAETGEDLRPFYADEIVIGPFTNLNTLGLSIESRIGDEDGQPSNLRIEKIQQDFTLRTGTQGSPREQYRRCSNVCEVLKRIIKKIIEEYPKELYKNWPKNGFPSYIGPSNFFYNITQFPIAQVKEVDYGYSGGVRLSLQSLYFQILKSGNE